MFANYLATALRNLARNGPYAGVTIAGLAIAFAAAILIGGANVLVDFFVATGKGI